ncbi:MAG: hydrogenase maturation nickel metallochaperone HypA, partial [Deltaproteobacteria bacterium]|nr:hydrogenase maturation nickel metallochaperone HypA [Deltaproteobacteria bacterium]
MHELQVTERILDIVLRHAQTNGANRIISIQLKIGELSDLENEWVQKYFDHLSKDTIAKNAKLKIERIPVVMKCDDCEHSFEINIKEIKDIQCPECAHK